MNIKGICTTSPDKSITFQTENGDIYKFNAQEYIQGEWYSELNDYHYFSKVEVIFSEAFCWPNGQDIAPEDINEKSYLIAKAD